MEWKKIVAMDQYTGDIIWEWIERGGLASSPALYEGKIYSYSHDGFMRCLSLLDGGELWATSISRPRNSEVERFRLWPSPAIADGKVYIGSVDGIFFCLDANTGEILWGHKTDGPSHSVPAITSGKVLISSTGGMLYCFGIDPETYKMKADQYIENEDYGRAEEFLIKVKEYAEDSEDIARIDELLDTVQSKMPEYQNRMEKLSEAESLMDEADKIIWDKKFEEAKNLYVKAHEIFEEVEDELGISFCENRISYIHERITLQEKEKAYSWLLIVLFCIAIASVFLIGKYIK